MKTKEEVYRKDWMSDDQYECHKMLADVVGGFHHIYNDVKPFGDGIKTNIHGQWASFDFNQLTRLIVLGHDRMIRVAIERCNMQYFCLVLHKRHNRDGHMYERHPTIEEAVKTIRGTD